MACPGCLEGCEADRFAPFADQPISTEATIDGAFLKTVVLPALGSMVPQHAHATAHLTAVVRGGIRVWVNGKLDRDYHAPEGVVIPAGDLHHFQTIKPDTRLLCIHDVTDQPVRIVRENALPGVA